MKNKRLLVLLAALAVSAGTVTAFTSCDGLAGLIPGFGQEQGTAESLNVATPPAKTTYVVGETFDPTGMVVNAVYPDGTQKAVTDYKIAPEGKLTLKDTKVTITWGDLSVVQKIKVKNDIVSLAVKTEPTKTVYLLNETFDVAGMVITVTYENGDVVDVELTKDNCTYKTEGVTADDTEIEITYGGQTVRQAITLAQGVFIEAENGVINSETGGVFTDAVGLGDPYDATGGAYVGDVFANESVVFQFLSDTAGEGSIAFRLASKYLKKDNNWVPIWMGDCQFNKICEFYVNGVKYDIPDSVILPGGGSEDGEANQNLWFNWQEVGFENIQFIEGLNEIELKFIKHDYTDTSQASFSGSFTANIDSLKVTSAECSVTPYLRYINALAVTDVNIEIVDEVPYYVLTGTIDTNYGASELTKKLEFDLQENGGSWGQKLANASDRVFTVAEDGTFAMRVNISSLADGGYISHFAQLNEGVISKEDLKIESVTDGKSVVNKYTTYTIVNKYGATESADFFGCIGLQIVTNDPRVFNYDSAAATVLSFAEENGKPVLAIAGTFTQEGCSEQDIIDKIKEIHFDAQGNPHMQAYFETGNTGEWNGDWSYYEPECIGVSFDLEKGTYVAKYDLSTLPDKNYCYTCHYGASNSSDFKPATDNFSIDVTIGSKLYTVSFTKDGGNEGFYGCIGIRVQDAPVATPEENPQA